MASDWCRYFAYRRLQARGIIDVCEYYAVDVNECMAFGDGMNDLEMFDLVGFAVAMGDAQPALVERADFVTGTIEEYGIQAVLEPFYAAPVAK